MEMTVHPHQWEASIMERWTAIIKETFDKWQADEAPRLGASLAYYAIFSMAPLRASLAIFDEAGGIKQIDEEYK